MECYNCDEVVTNYKELRYYEEEWDDLDGEVVFEKLFVNEDEGLCEDCYKKLKESDKHTIELK